jgi:hypothetical protein
VGAPHSVGANFYCNNNPLTSLEGAPQTVYGDFIYYNRGLARNNQLSTNTIKGIFALMKKGESYQKALEEYWPEMVEEDKVLMYKEMPNLSPEDVRKYKALATYGSIKNYL